MIQRQLFSYTFIGAALIAFLNSPDRNDYNLPLSIFAFFLWNNKPYNQRHRILWLLLLSIICDAIWFFGVTVVEWTQNSQGNDLRGLTQTLSIFNLCWKIVLIIYAVASVEGCQSLFTVLAFRSEVLFLKQ